MRGVQVKLWDPLRTLPYLSALEVCWRWGAIQIHVYLTFTYCTTNYHTSLPKRCMILFIQLQPSLHGVHYNTSAKCSEINMSPNCNATLFTNESIIYFSLHLKLALIVKNKKVCLNTVNYLLYYYGNQFIQHDQTCKTWIGVHSQIYRIVTLVPKYTRLYYVGTFYCFL